MRKRLLAFLLALFAVLPGCELVNSSRLPKIDELPATTEDEGPSETIVNDHITVYSNIDTSFIKESLGVDGLVAGTVKFFGEEQKLICYPSEGTVVVITGVSAITGCDNSKICYKIGDEYFKFDFADNIENVDSRFVVPDDALEYKFGLDGKLSEYAIDGNTYFCLESDGTARYFKQLSVQNEDFYGNDKYNMYVVEELCYYDIEQVTINVGDFETNEERKSKLRVLITGYGRLAYINRDEDTEIFGDECLLSCYAGHFVIARPSELFTGKFGRPAFNSLTIISGSMRDIYGNAIERESFGSDARNHKMCETSSVDFCIPTAVEGVYIVRFDGFSSAVLAITAEIPCAVATDYGVEPDGVVAFWDTRTKTRVLRITISGSGVARDIYWNDGTGLTTNADYLIPWEAHVAEEEAKKADKLSNDDMFYSNDNVTMATDASYGVTSCGFNFNESSYSYELIGNDTGKHFGKIDLSLLHDRSEAASSANITSGNARVLRRVHCVRRSNVSTGCRGRR